jgi:hypothetical protein
MKKIRLDADSLNVLSFATEVPAGAPKGTVHGLVGTVQTCETDCDNTCACMLLATFRYQTCRESEASCQFETCDTTCDLAAC